MPRPSSKLLFAAALFSATALSHAALAADRALVIGVGNYQSLDAAMSLAGPKNDVKAISGLLVETLGFQPDSVKVLEDAGATRQEILAAIDDWLIKGTQPGDRAYLYYSGRGLQLTDDNDDESDGLDEALSAYDTTSGANGYENTIRDDEIDAISTALKDRTLTLVFDAGYSANIETAEANADAQPAEGARFLPFIGKRPEPKLKTRGLRIDLGVVDKPDKVAETGGTTWAAASSYQVATDDVKKPEDQRQGVFTAAYVEGHTADKADYNKNGLVSNAEVYQSVKKESEAYCAGQADCKTLDPKLDVPAAALGASVTGSYQKYETPAKTDQAYVPAKTEEIKVPGTYTAAYVAADPVSAVYDIAGKTDDGGVTIKLDPGPALHAGEAFKVSVTSKQGGHLILLDVNSKGVATQIFPNEYAEKITPLKAGYTLTMPDDYYGFDFEAEGSGESIMVAIVVSDPVDLSGVAPKTRGLKAATDSRQSLGDICAKLQKTWTDDIENRGIKWSLGTMKYTVK
ncbi:caspase family protein [Pararhizobium sp.]|uniref:caspase family protein n=1 Tax=Pararhizobium sp. TaxID=1977563 RepID=UPI00271B6C3B|nr:caspase family protein [Pararhizobium sp.]MDO9418597.1 caspase family protein [Pararhizobium sp.]